MRRPPSRYLPHSYALMAMGAALTLVIGVVQLVQYAQATYTAWPVFVAGLVTAAYVASSWGSCSTCHASGSKRTQQPGRLRR